MDISNRFSLEDFLAYFFPGFAGTVGIYVALLLTPMQSSLKDFSVNIITGIFLLVLCYIMGVFLSCFAEPIARFYGKFNRKIPVKSIIPLPGCEDEIVSAYTQLFNISKEEEFAWTDSCFYLCRSLVLEYMPNITPIIQRQSGLRQLRMNMLPSLIIWLFTGILWGRWMLNNAQANWGIILLIASVVLFLLIVIFTLNRMYSNEKRETREVLSAFLVGYRTGKLGSGTKSGLCGK